MIFSCLCVSSYSTNAFMHLSCTLKKISTKFCERGSIVLNLSFVCGKCTHMTMACPYLMLCVDCCYMFNLVRPSDNSIRANCYHVSMEGGFQAVVNRKSVFTILFYIFHDLLFFSNWNAIIFSQPGISQEIGCNVKGS